MTAEEERFFVAELARRWLVTNAGVSDGKSLAGFYYEVGKQLKAASQVEKEMAAICAARRQKEQEHALDCKVFMEREIAAQKVCPHPSAVLKPGRCDLCGGGVS